MSISNTSTQHCTGSPSQSTEGRNQTLEIRKERKFYSQIFGYIECRRGVQPYYSQQTCVAGTQERQETKEMLILSNRCYKMQFYTVI